MTLPATAGIFHCHLQQNNTASIAGNNESIIEVPMTFQKGRSPNPDGRKIEARMKRAARAEGHGCVLALASVRDDATAAPEIRAQAALRLLELAKWNVGSRVGFGQDLQRHTA
jgi:hypothetical protein